MLVKSENQCAAFLANDGCHIRELLHPENESVELGFSLAIAEVDAHQETYRHRLRQAEVYYILSGSGVMHIEQEVRNVGVGDAIFIPPGALQWIENNSGETLKFAAIVSPAWRSEDDERV